MYGSTRSNRPWWQAPLAGLVALMLVASGLGIGSAGAAITQVGSAVTANGTASGTLALTAPALAAGDLLIAQVTVAKDLGSSDVICAPAAWTPVGARLDYNSRKIVHQIYKLKAAAAAAATSYTWTLRNSSCSGSVLSNRGMTGGILHFSGADDVDVVQHSGTNAGSSETATAPTASASQPGSTVLRFFSAFKSPLTFNTVALPATTPTRLYTLGSSNNSSERTAGAYSATQASAGNTGTFAAKMNTSAEWIATTVVLKPKTNTAPTVSSISGAASVNEGSTGAYSVTATDPDGDALTYAWSVTAGNAAISGPATGSSANVAFGDGPSAVTLQVLVDDGKGGVVLRTVGVTVTNVAPVATFNAPTAVDEGSPIPLSLTGATDPSAADTAAGFTYAFDCGSGYGAFGATSSTSCSTTDQGSRTVKGTVQDKDGGITEYTASVTINNVAPTATFAASPEQLDEGGSFDLSLTGPSDPSAVDTAAGFTYAFDCGDGYGAFAVASSTSCSTTDQGSRSVKGKIQDKDGGISEYTATVGVDNVAPSAVFQAPSPVDEGDDIALSLTDPSDPSSDDTTAGFTHAFDCGSGSLSAYAAPNTASCPTSDDGGRTVRGSIMDKDLAATTYTAEVTILNVAPSAAFGAPGTVDEGSSIALSLTGPSDPSSADMAAGFTYSFNCGAVAEFDDGWSAFDSSSVAACATDDSGVRTVGGRIQDKDGGITTYTASVTVSNVAPTAEFLGGPPDGNVDEGDVIELAAINAYDPSAADTTAGFEYAFDCGAGYGAFDSANTAFCPTDDNTPPGLPLTVRAKVRDKDGGVTEYQATVAVLNVAPSATLLAPASVNEGEDIELSVVDVEDPSSVDTAAGFTYAFDCGDGFGSFGAAATIACPTSDEGTPTVGARVRDKDGDDTQYLWDVEILNVAPIATFGAPSAVEEGSPIVLSLTDPFDPSSVDTSAGFTYAFDCGDGVGYGAFGTDASTSCSTTDDGLRTTGAKIQDEDGGVSEYTATVTVNNVAPTATFSAGAADGSLDEGDDIVLSLEDPFDPSSDDVAAGLTYSFDCGAGFGAPGSTPTASCPTDDNGSRVVTAKVHDKDGGFTPYTATLSVGSVAPTATFDPPSSVDEGSDIDLALTDPFDPSALDTAAGFTHAFDCGDGNGYGPHASANVAACSTTDDGSRDVGGQIKDKDEHLSQYTASVTVNNIAPTATLSSSGTVDEGDDIELSFGDPFDPSSADTAAGFEYAFDCGAGSGFGAYSNDTSIECPTSDNGVRTVGGRIRDKDGGVTEYTASATINNVPPAVTAPAGASTLTAVSTSFALGSFSDPGVDDDLWTVAVSWGDSTSESFTTSTQGSLGSRAHTYAAAGAYTVTVRVTDKDLGWSEATFNIEVRITDHVLLSHDVEISGAKSSVNGDVHANRNVKISGGQGTVCGDITAGGTVSSMSAQVCGTTTSGAPLVPLPNMAHYVPGTGAITHTLAGDRQLNGYACTLASGCVVRVTGKLEIRGAISGKVWFLVDKDVVVKGALAPANASSALRIYSKLSIDAPVSKVTIVGIFLAEKDLKLSGSEQKLTGLFWGKALVDHSGSRGLLTGAMISNGLIKIAGADRTVTYDAEAIKI